MTQHGGRVPAERADHDPTGIRDLLASLPDPGPMPDVVARRIEASLAQEAASHRTVSGPEAVGSSGTSTPRVPEAGTPGTGDGTVVRLSRRSTGHGGPVRRRPGHRALPWLGAVAATVTLGTAIGVGSFTLLGDDAGEGTVNAVQPGLDEVLEQQADPGPSAGDAPNPFSDVKVWNTGQAYDSGDFAAQADAFLDQSRVGELGHVVGSADPVNAVRQCVSGLPEVDPGQIETVRADTITYDEQPARLLSVQFVDGRVQTWAVAAECGATTTVLDGPVTPSS